MDIDHGFNPLRLYALCDQAMLDHAGISLESFIARCIDLNAEIIQYRNKSDNIEIIASQLTRLRSMWSKTLIVNDMLPLHKMCDGVHVGQEDLARIAADEKTAVGMIREIVGRKKLIGLSTHDMDEILQANGLDIDYIGLGAYRNTDTKSDAQVLSDSLDSLASISLHPVAAIGGVRLDDRFRHVTYNVIGSGLFVG